MPGVIRESFLEHQGNTLKVEGLEAVDGSPIIDIKPYSKHYYGAENPTVPDWMAQIQRELGNGSTAIPDKDHPEEKK